MTKVKRHKTAIIRPDLSLPVKCLLRDNLLDPSRTFFDYGCGHGRDLELLQKLGVVCSGWDPAFRPDNPIVSANVVNLGFVINVIESADERSETLRRAWTLSGEVLSIAAQIQIPGRGNQQVPFNDGILTRLDTFQKYFTQAELRAYIESTLQTEAHPAAPGIFFVFKCDELRQQYVATRYRRHTTAPRQRLSERRFEEHREILEPFIRSLSELGRVPDESEFAGNHQIVDTFGSLNRAFALVKRVTGHDEWSNIKSRRTEDLLVYLALGRFRKRPQFSRLPISLQRDVRAFFGTYKRACQQADDLLFAAGDAEAVDAACKRSSVGKLLPKSLYVHRSALESLEPILRVYEGCGRAWIGELDGANIIKLHRHSGKISYLSYPDFERDPHPSLIRCVKIALRTLDLHCYDYSLSKNPPILHRKEAFLTDDHPLHSKFVRLTRQEDKQGLLESAAMIGTRDGWNARLQQQGFELRGHRLIRCLSHATSKTSVSSRKQGDV